MHIRHDSHKIKDLPRGEPEISKEHTAARGPLHISSLLLGRPIYSKTGLILDSQDITVAAQRRNKISMHYIVIRPHFHEHIVKLFAHYMTDTSECKMCGGGDSKTVIFPHPALSPQANFSPLVVCALGYILYPHLLTNKKITKACGK